MEQPKITLEEWEKSLYETQERLIQELEHWENQKGVPRNPNSKTNPTDLQDLEKKISNLVKEYIGWIQNHQNNFENRNGFLEILQKVRNQWLEWTEGAPRGGRSFEVAGVIMEQFGEVLQDSVVLENLDQEQFHKLLTGIYQNMIHIAENISTQGMSKLDSSIQELHSLLRKYLFRHRDILTVTYSLLWRWLSKKHPKNPSIDKIRKLLSDLRVWVVTDPSISHDPDSTRNIKYDYEDGDCFVKFTIQHRNKVVKNIMLVRPIAKGKFIMEEPEDGGFEFLCMSNMKVQLQIFTDDKKPPIEYVETMQSGLSNRVAKEFVVYSYVCTVKK